MITNIEAEPCAKVEILVTRESSRFPKGGLKKGDIGFIKAVSGNPWESGADRIWVTKNSKDVLVSFGFSPEELKLIERIKREEALPGTEVIAKGKSHGVSASKCGLKLNEKLYITRIVGDPWEDESDKSYIETSYISGDKNPLRVFNFKPEDLKISKK